MKGKLPSRLRSLTTLSLLILMAYNSTTPLRYMHRLTFTIIAALEPAGNKHAWIVSFGTSEHITGSDAPPEAVR